MLHYDTNPNLFLEFFYLLRFSRSDLHKFFLRTTEKKIKKNKNKKNKKTPPKKKKFGKFAETRPKKIWACFDDFFFFREQN